MKKKIVLVTGGAGYIGSHTAVALADAGYETLILDNFQNSSSRVLDRLSLLGAAPIELFNGDVREKQLLDQIFEKYTVDAVIHFAALKAVGESIEQPTRYLENNVGGLLTLLESMKKAGVVRLVFSSSATVYGEPGVVPIPETAPLSATNPYARTKLMCEDALREVFNVSREWQIAILRYFNPIGAHISGLLGEAPTGKPNNLMPYITEVAMKRRPYLEVFGDDYETPDGTCIRDYLHVSDLAEGHVAALHAVEDHAFITANLGTGRGVSVKEIVKTFEQVNQITIPLKYVGRRRGDVAKSFAATERAERLFGWRTKRSIEQACKDTWNWRQKNPEGFNALS